jgi:hypothetical protein
MHMEMNRVLATFPIADNKILWTYMPTTNEAPCNAGTINQVVSYDANGQPVTEQRPSPDPNKKCGYTYDFDARWGGYDYLALNAKNWNYDVGIGIVFYEAQQLGGHIILDPCVAFKTTIPNQPHESPWCFAHEFNHVIGMSDNINVDYWDSCKNLVAEPGFWVNRYQPRTGNIYFQNGPPSGDNVWITNSPLSTRNCNLTINPNPPDWDGYSNYLNNPRFVDSDPLVVVVNGVVSKNGTASFGSFVILPEGNLDLEPGTTGNYNFVLYDTDGKVVSKTGFNPSFYMSKPQFNTTTSFSSWGPQDYEYFVERIEWKPETKRIEIQDKSGKTLATRIVSVHPPVVKILTPVGGESWMQGQPVTIRWEGSDPDGDPLTYNIGISSDGGKNWVPLGIVPTANEYSIIPGGLKSGDQFRVKVIASDGVNTVESVSTADFKVKSPGDNSTLLVIISGLIVAIGVITGVWYIMKKRKQTMNNK